MRLPWVHIVLFVLTGLTTLTAGALQQGVNPLRQPWGLLEGLPFSASLMLILLSHELSHYVASRVHHTKASLPYFIPAPTIIGTFGAVIKMRSPIITRRALIDIGASGPIAGFIVSVLASVVGLARSEVVPTGTTEGALVLGDSLLFKLLSLMVLGPVPEGYDVLLHPVAFAGWIGLFITSLNLIPVGQLDGGHIAYGLLGARHRTVSVALVVALALMGMAFWQGWSLWALLLLLLGLRHPPVLQWEIPLPRQHRLVGLAALAIFILTFTPTPFRIM
jgi:membrane-associated protease RseP (regulator of RpoE activity)